MHKLDFLAPRRSNTTSLNRLLQYGQVIPTYCRIEWSPRPVALFEGFSSIVDTTNKSYLPMLYYKPQTKMYSTPRTLSLTIAHVTNSPDRSGGETTSDCFTFATVKTDPVRRGVVSAKRGVPRPSFKRSTQTSKLVFHFCFSPI